MRYSDCRCRNSHGTEIKRQAKKAGAINTGKFSVAPQKTNKRKGIEPSLCDCLFQEVPNDEDRIAGVDRPLSAIFRPKLENYGRLW